MRKLIWTILILAALYSGYWFVGSSLLQGRIDQWAAEEKAAERLNQAASLKVQGFPSRFDIDARDIEYFDPQTGYGWSAPRAQVAALSYMPQKYIAVLPPEQQIRIPGAILSLTSTDMRASLGFAPGPSFVLDRMNFVTTGLTLAAEASQLRTGAAELRFATERAKSSETASGSAAASPALSENAHRIGLTVLGLIVPEIALEQLRSLPTELPATFDQIHLDAVVDFDRRIDRHALRGAKPQPTRVSLADLSLTWGPIGFALGGDLQLDAAGVATGPINLTIRGMTQILDIAVASGLLPAERRRMIEGSIGLLAKPDAEGNLRLSFQARDGMLYLGPLGLTPLPKLRLQ